MFDQVIFKNKTFADILEEIHKDYKTKDKQVNCLINELSPLVADQGNAMVVVPLIKEYLEISVKNSDNLIKMAGIVQRAMARNVDGSQGEMLPEEEREALIQMIRDKEEEPKQKLISVSL